ncbi:hypothetical protein M569_16296 [Genlisea aurea]|uniref:Cytochrome b5 heme-binding domain-containing protein n=1 Tax=Genlisea aurea TaxID=192259 RepID=S8DGL8_9LAMI|nr:hypothetical protein M569_16296 [Genlisea aurea]
MRRCSKVCSSSCPASSLERKGTSYMDVLSSSAFAAVAVGRGFVERIGALKLSCCCCMGGVLSIASQNSSSFPGDGKLKIQLNSTSSKAPKTYTKAQVSHHNKRTDCWIIIKQKVYDVTPYVEEHPGGDAILNHAGDDSTEGFFGPQHGTRVFDMIDDFCIGDLIT